MQQTQGTKALLLSHGSLLLLCQETKSWNVMPKRVRDYCQWLPFSKGACGVSGG